MWVQGGMNKQLGVERIGVEGLGSLRGLMKVPLSGEPRHFYLGTLG